MTTRRPSSPPASLLLDPNIRRVWWTGLISSIGDSALFVALPVQTYTETHSPLATAVVVISGAVPATLVGQLAGVLVDRLDYRRVLIWANLLIALVTLTFIAGAHLPWWALGLINLLGSSVTQFIRPAEHALLPLLAGHGRLGEVSSLNALSGNLARLLGPALGGLVLVHVGFAAVIVLDVLTYLAAAVLMTGVPPSAAGRPANTRRRLWLDWTEGLQVVRASGPLGTVFVAAATVAFGEGFISTLMVPFVTRTLGGSGQTLGLIFSSQAVGGLIAAGLLTRLADRTSSLRLLAAGALGSGLMLLLYFNYRQLYPHLWPAMVVTALAGLPFTMFGTAQTRSLQRFSPQPVMGRVFTACAGLLALTQLLGMGVSGVLGERFGVWVINIDAVTYLLAALFTVLAIRRLGTEQGD